MEESYLSKCNKNYINYEFTPEKIEALERCGITPSLTAVSFYQHLAELIEFVDKNHRFPNNSCREEVRLRSWLKRAILGYSLYFDKEKAAKYRNKYYYKFSNEEINILKQLNFPQKFLGVFNIRINAEGKFEYYIEDLEKLQQYVRVNHKFPSHQTQENDRLRSWIKNMCCARDSYFEKLKNNTQEPDENISQRFGKEVIDYLDSFNFPWSVSGWSRVYLDENGKFVAIPKSKKIKVSPNENIIFSDNGKGEPGE